MGENSVTHPRERQALEIDLAGSLQGGKEQSFAAEEHRLEISGPLDRIVYARSERDDASGIHTNRLAIQIDGNNRTAGMDKRHSIALQFL